MGQEEVAASWPDCLAFCLLHRIPLRVESDDLLLLGGEEVQG